MDSKSIRQMRITSTANTQRIYTHTHTFLTLHNRHTWMPTTGNSVRSIKLALFKLAHAYQSYSYSTKIMFHKISAFILCCFHFVWMFFLLFLLLSISPFSAYPIPNATVMDNTVWRFVLPNLRPNKRENIHETYIRCSILKMNTNSIKYNSIFDCSFWNSTGEKMTKTEIFMKLFLHQFSWRRKI